MQRDEEADAAGGVSFSGDAKRGHLAGDAELDAHVDPLIVTRAAISLERERFRNTADLAAGIEELTGELSWHTEPPEVGAEAVRQWIESGIDEVDEPGARLCQLVSEVYDMLSDDQFLALLDRLPTSYLRSALPAARLPYQKQRDRRWVDKARKNIGAYPTAAKEFALVAFTEGQTDHWRAMLDQVLSGTPVTDLTDVNQILDTTGMIGHLADLAVADPDDAAITAVVWVMGTLAWLISVEDTSAADAVLMVHTVLSDMCAQYLPASPYLSALSEQLLLLATTGSDPRRGGDACPEKRASALLDAYLAGAREPEATLVALGESGLRDMLDGLIDGLGQLRARGTFPDNESLFTSQLALANVSSAMLAIGDLAASAGANPDLWSVIEQLELADDTYPEQIADLLAIVGPDDLVDRVSALVNDIRTTLLDSSNWDRVHVPKGLGALWRIVDGNERARDDLTVFLASDFGDPHLSTAAWAGELTFGRGEDSNETGPASDDAGQTPPGQSARGALPSLADIGESDATKEAILPPGFERTQPMLPGTGEKTSGNKRPSRLTAHPSKSDGSSEAATEEIASEETGAEALNADHAVSPATDDHADTDLVDEAETTDGACADDDGTNPSLVEIAGKNLETETTQTDHGDGERGPAAEATGLNQVIDRVAVTGDQERGNPGLDEIARSTLIAALSNQRYSAAYHVAAAANMPEAAVYQFAGYATNVAASTGPMAAAITDYTPELLDADGSIPTSGERGAVELAYFSATRAALVAPYSGATDILTAAGRSLSNLADFAQAVNLTAAQGIAMIDDVLAQASELSDAERWVKETAHAAETWKNQAASRSIKYFRASDVLHAIVSDSGPLGKLCNIAATKKWKSEIACREAALSVRAEVVNLRAKSAASDAFTKAHPKASEIHSGALARLMEYWDAGLDAVAAWADAVVALDKARHAGEGSWQVAALSRLRDAHDQHRKALHQLVDELCGDTNKLTAATGQACRTILDSIQEMFAGTRDAQLDLSPMALANLDLIAGTSIALRDDWTPTISEDQVELRIYESDSLHRMATAVHKTLPDTLVDTFHVRIGLEDHVGTRLALSALRALGSAEEEIDELADADALTADTNRHAVSRLHAETEALIAADSRLGYIDETIRQHWTAELLACDPQNRDNLGLIRDELERIKDASALNRKERTQEVRSEISAAADADSRIRSAIDRIMDRVDADDLATAWEYVSLIQEGEAIPDPPEPPVGAEEYWPDVDQAILEQVNLNQRAVGTAAAMGETCGPLDFSGLSEADRAAAKAGIDSWRALANLNRPGKNYREVATHLPNIAIAIGLTLGGYAKSSIGSDREHDRVWVDLTKTHASGDPIVPAYAPDQLGRRIMRLLIISGAPDLGQLEAAVDREQSGDPVMVLHLGPLGPDERARIAEQFRAVGRTVIVIDDNLFAYLMSTGPRRYERTMRLTLPFATTNPYNLDASGQVPATMFFGRRAELAAIMRSEGTCFLYGGRQLGKSALLRHAERTFNNIEGQVAIYVDLKGAQVGRPRPPEAVFEVLWPRLAAVGIVDGEMPQAGLADAISNAIDRWLVGQSGRRLLILLDECDNFLKADAEKDLTTSARLKNVMERTNRACKVVFAGLHTVQRFAGVANSPLPHLGTPEGIGPLEGAAAADLIMKPLAALGYRFEDPELVNRILAHTSRQPALLVIFCHHLLRRLQSQSRKNGEPPTTITEADVDGVWSDPGVAQAIRERVQWTLALDPKYEVIVYALAWRALNDDGTGGRLTVNELQEQCSYWWPDGFSAMASESVRLYCEELIGLGVLAREGKRYGLRNPNVARLLGSTDDIETVLQEAHTHKPGEVFEPSLWRREITSETVQYRSPLSDAQLDTIYTADIQAIMVAGSDANHLDRVVDTLTLAAPSQLKVTARTWNDGNLEAMLQASSADRHRLAVIDLRGAQPVKATVFLDRVNAIVSDPKRRTGHRTWSVVLVADAAADGPIVRYATGLDSVTQLPLLRWSPQAISEFGKDRSPAMANSQEATAVHNRTGGWGYLIEEIADGVSGTVNFAAVLDSIDTERLVQQLGMDTHNVLTAAFTEAVDLIPDAEAGADLATIKDLICDADRVKEALRVEEERSGVHAASGQAVIEQLVLADLLVVGPQSVWVETVAADALRTHTEGQ